MGFNLVSKNNMGVIMTLTLAVLLSQSKFFDFLINFALGRMVLLAFVILIAYTNKNLGLVAILFIIIGFNQNDVNMVHSYNYYEGFDVSGNTLKVPIKMKEDQLDITTSTSSSISGSEGFCMTDRETNMLRGKQSSTVPVFNNLREQTDDVSPSDKSMFTGEYATF